MTKQILITLLLGASLSYGQAPQIPVTGTLGAGGNFPAISSPAVVFASDANHTMVYPETSGSSGVIVVTSTTSLTTTRSLIVPLVRGFNWQIQNSTSGGQSILVRGTSGSGVTIANGTTVIVHADGTNITTIAGSGATPAGATNAIQTNNGSGGLGDSGCTAVSGAITCPGSGGASGYFGLGQGTSHSVVANTVLFQAPASVTGYALTMPGAQGTGALTNNGSGILSWVPGGGASPAGPTNALQTNDGSGGFGDSGCTAVSGAITCPGSGGASGYFGLGQGTSHSVVANTVLFQAPASVTGYVLTMPGAQGAGALTNNGSGILSWVPGGGGTPGGSNTQMQFNNSGAFGGSNLTWNSGTSTLGMGNTDNLYFGDTSISPTYGRDAQYNFRIHPSVEGHPATHDSIAVFNQMIPNFGADKSSSVVTGLLNESIITDAFALGTAYGNVNAVYVQGSGHINHAVGISTDAALTDGSTSLVDDLRGIEVAAENGTAGTVTDAAALTASFGTYSTGTIANGYGLRVLSSSAVGSNNNITNAYGIYIGAIDRGTNKYNLYSAGASSSNLFEGNITAQGNLAMSSGKVISWNGDAGISRCGADCIAMGDGTVGSVIGRLEAAEFAAVSYGLFTWNSDTGFSRCGAACVAVGNSAANDVSATLKAAAGVFGTSTVVNSGSANNGLLTTTKLALNANSPLAWTSSATDASASVDTTFSRLGSGRVGLGIAAGGSTGELDLGTLAAAAVTVGGNPVCQSNGTNCPIFTLGSGSILYNFISPGPIAANTCLGSIPIVVSGASASSTFFSTIHTSSPSDVSTYAGLITKAEWNGTDVSISLCNVTSSASASIGSIGFNVTRYN